uniref:Uncharacterized protein n=1 Tax=Arundo donax TaxID=35708 RepID=A0A0A9H305_ARUDO
MLNSEARILELERTSGFYGTYYFCHNYSFPTFSFSIRCRDLCCKFLLVVVIAFASLSRLAATK